MNDCPMADGSNPKPLEGYTCSIFIDLIEGYWSWTEHGISPGLRPMGRGSLNPLVVEAWRRIGAAEGRKRNRDRLRTANKAAANSAQRS